MDVKDIRGNNNNHHLMMSSDEVDDEMDLLRRGPWTVDEDLTLINYIATHGEGRWNTLALSAGLKRTGKSCRLRWLNYLRPNVRRGNITLEEQLLILELHNRWGNRWSKIAHYLPGRTDNEIKNYWRTRVQKLAKQLKCDVDSKQFKDTMRYLWMPRLVERIQLAATSTSATATTSTSQPLCTNNNNNNNGKMGLTMKNEFVGSESQSYHITSENSNTTASSSDSFGNHVSTISFSDENNYHYYYNNNNNNVPASIISSNKDNYPNNYPSDYYYQQPSQDFQSVEPNKAPWMQQSVDSSDNILWNAENMLFLQQQLMNDTAM